MHGCQIIHIWPFQNDLPEIKLFVHFLASFWMLKKMVYFKPVLQKSEQMLNFFNEIFTLSLAIFTIFWIKHLAFIHFRVFHYYFAIAYGQIWLFNFIWTWQPWCDVVNSKLPFFKLISKLPCFFEILLLSRLSWF